MLNRSPLSSPLRHAPQRVFSGAGTPFARPQNWWLAAAAAAAVLSMASVQAQSGTPQRVVPYAIPAQSLAQTVNRLAQESGVAVAADANLLAGHTAGAISGELTLEQALEKALQGSGLVAVQNGSSWTIVRATANAATSSAAALPEVTVSATRWGESTEGTGSYTPQAVAAGSKVAQSARETARSISVLTRQQLDDQKIHSVDEAMEQMSGVTVVQGSGLKASQYYARGHQITNFTVDGSPAASYHSNDTTVNSGMVKYDNVQLVRGPDGLFSGNGGPSGTINFVRKRPTDEWRIAGTASVGRWSNYYTDIDVGGPLNEAGSLRGRVVAAHNDRKYFFKGAHRKINSIYGILEMDLLPTTMLSFGGSIDRDRGSGRGTPPGFPRYSNGVPLPVPRDQGYAKWSHTDTESKNVFASLDHAFNDQWKGRFSTSYTDSDVETNASSYVGQVNPITGLGAQMFPGSWGESKFNTITADAYVHGNFEVLGRKQQLLVGADYRHSNGKYALFGATAKSVDINDWGFVDPDALIPWNERGAPSNINSGKTKQKGIYANLKSQIYGPVSLVLGGRYATYEYVSFSRKPDQAFNPTLTNKTNNIFTPYYALMWDINDTWTTYLSTSGGYQDQSDKFSAGFVPLSPSKSRSYELGIKGELWDGKLQTSAAVYHSKRNNFAIRDSVNTEFDVPGRSCCWLGDGRFLSQGVEFDVGGEVLPGWQVSGGYTYDDNKTDYGSDKGERFASYTPKHILRVWSSYQFRDQLAGWKVGGGMRAQSSFFRSGNVSTWNADKQDFSGPSESFAFTEPGRAIWSAFVEYRFNRHWTAALNIDNLFDKTYFQSVGDTRNWFNDGSFYGEPRNVRFTVRGSF